MSVDECIECDAAIAGKPAPTWIAVCEHSQQCPHRRRRFFVGRDHQGKLDNSTKQTVSGENFLTINPKGYVAALQLANGDVLTEGPAILQYLADLRPEANLAPANGVFERVRLQEWLNFVSTEIHGGLGWLFNSQFPGDVKALIKEKLFKRFVVLSQTLEGQDYLLAGGFSIADAYLFTVLRWARLFAIDLDDWPALAWFQARVDQRPSVKAALAAELV